MTLVIPRPMIGWLMGLHLENWKQGSRSGVLLNCSGVGYEIHLAPRHLSNLLEGNELSLWIHQVQREDGSSLYGFPRREERDLFRLLISVNGLGPQSGLALLQECRPHELVEAISNGDLRTLCRAQGIGKRTAERLVLDLRDKVSLSADISEIETQDGTGSAISEEAAMALMALGMTPSEARQAVRKAIERNGSDLTVQQLIKFALKER